MSAIPGPQPPSDAGGPPGLPPDRQRKKEEFRTWFFLTVVMAPVLAAVIVFGYGFLVWIYQMIAGPPTYH